MSGHKRHIVVDTMGLLLAVVIHASTYQDRDAAGLLLAKLFDQETQPMMGPKEA